MWRSNYQEDWERRKTYLIRSLFQDIPVLSPVPEDQESRYGAVSPSDFPTSRPHSPLPPLIIERVPNRHDHPEKFYQDLERKMKKLYRKLFLEGRGSPVDDLIEGYAGDFDIQSLMDQFGEYQGNNVEVDSYPGILTENSYNIMNNTDKRSPGKKKSREDTIDNKGRQRLSRISIRRSIDGSQISEGVESSTQSLYATQVTIVADVHAQSSQSPKENTATEDISDEEETVVLSPILESKRKMVDENVYSQNDENDKSEYDEEILGEDEIDEEDTNGGVESNENEYSDIANSDAATNEKDLARSVSETTDKSVELMRRHRRVSSRLGSLPKDTIYADSSGLSLTYTDIEFQRKISFEKTDQDDSFESELPTLRSILSLDEVPNGDFSDLSTPTLRRERHDRFSREAIRRRRTSSAEDSLPPVTKRRKHENVAIQTSPASENDNRSNWNQLRNHFFVGIPRIYKLCICNDHSCHNSC